MERRLDYPHISVVVIGRNEAPNLPACFKSIRQMDYPQDKLDVIYVDTNSTDDSVQVAHQWGVRIVQENSDSPSAALARNRGMREAKHEIIHFLDGDVTIGPAYLKLAVQSLGEDRVACIIGKLDERHKNRNLISWILHYNWASREPGFVDAPGAGGTFLKSILSTLGGYNTEILRGEETELGIRLCENGHRILMIDEIMGTHDFGINISNGLIRFFLSMGRSFGRAFFLPPSRFSTGERASARNTMIQMALLVVCILVICMARRWLFLLFLPVAGALYVVIRHWNANPERRLHALAYYLLMYTGKPVMTIGILRLWWKHTRLSLRRRGKPL